MDVTPKQIVRETFREGLADLETVIENYRISPNKYNYDELMRCLNNSQRYGERKALLLFDRSTTDQATSQT